MNNEKELLAQEIFTILIENELNTYDDIIDKLADGLIARGYVKMPCKIGDKIYYANMEITGNIGQPKSVKTYTSWHKVKDEKDCIECAFQIIVGDAFRTKNEAQNQCRKYEKEYKQ